MSDIAMAMLSRHIMDSDACGLWVVDENFSLADIAELRPRDNLQVVTNRFDVYFVLQQRGFSVALSDCDFSSFTEGQFQEIYYRVSKEKALVHHVINCAASILAAEGSLYLSGYKNEGTKTYIQKAASLLGELGNEKLGGKTAMLAKVTSGDGDGKLLDDKDYMRERLIGSQDSKQFVSKPGIFGWNKIDRGSALLIEKLPDFLATLDYPVETVLDLGCGYGYLSVMASELLPARYLASDNNIASVDLCQKNFQRLNVRGCVSVGDCASNIDEQVDLIICNPPFHQGFDVELALTKHFLQACRQHLKKSRHAFFVVNSFVPLEKKATAYFARVEVFYRSSQFKLVAVS